MRSEKTTSASRDRNWILGVVAVATGIGALGCTGPDPYYRDSSKTTLIRCRFQRQECSEFNNLANPTSCNTVDPVARNVEGDLCVNELDQTPPAQLCGQQFCRTGLDAPGTCQVISAQATTASPECIVPTSGFTQLKDVRLHSVEEDWDNSNGLSSVPGVARDPLLGTPSDAPICVPPGTRPLDWVESHNFDYSTAVRIGQAIPNSAECTAESDTAIFSLNAAPVATTSAAGTTATLRALRGLVRIGRSCADGFCDPRAIDDFQVDLADLTVSGVALRKLRIRSVMPTPITPVFEPDSGMVPGIARGALRLRAEGQMNGVDTQFSIVNTSPLLVEAGASFRLRGTLVLKAPIPTGGVLDVVVSVDANGPLATPQAVACGNQSWLERLFGFEDAQAWSSSQAALSLVTSPVQQGCGALGVAGAGFMSIAGGQFSTRGLMTNAALSVDLFIPGGQPNPYWTGALQAHLSCPSGSVNNQYIGQVELTGKPLNRYSTLRFPLSSAVRTSLARPLDDCSFTFGLNVNPTGNNWILDRLRFTQ